MCNCPKFTYRIVGKYYSPGNGRRDIDYLVYDTDEHELKKHLKKKEDFLEGCGFEYRVFKMDEVKLNGA